MDFLHIVVMIEYGLQAGLALVGAGMVIWAMADAARRPTTAFENHTNQTKATWLLILGGALIFGLGSAALTVFYGGQMGLFRSEERRVGKAGSGRRRGDRGLG